MAIHLPFLSRYFCKSMPSSWQKVALHHQFASRCASHLYRNTFAEVLRRWDTAKLRAVLADVPSLRCLVLSFLFARFRFLVPSLLFFVPSFQFLVPRNSRQNQPFANYHLRTPEAACPLIPHLELLTKGGKDTPIPSLGQN